MLLFSIGSSFRASRMAKTLPSIFITIFIEIEMFRFIFIYIYIYIYIAQTFYEIMNYWILFMKRTQVRNHKRPNFGPVVANMLPRLGRQCCAITEMISKGCTWPPSLARHWLPVLARNRHMLMAHYRNDI